MNVVFKSGNSSNEHIKTIIEKVLVYDTSRGFAAEVRKKLNKDYNVVCCLRPSDLKKIDLDTFFAAIIIINDPLDFEKIENIKLKIKNLIVSSSLKKSYLDYSSLGNIIIFELNMSRKDTISFF